MSPSYEEKPAFILPSSLLIASLALYLWRDTWMITLVTRFPDEIRAAYLLNRALLLALWVTGTWTFLSLSRSLVNLKIFSLAEGQRVPLLVTLLFRFTIILVATVFVLVSVFNMSPLSVGLLFAGGVVLGVLFLRNIFSELMAGLSLNLDRRFTHGARLALTDGTFGAIKEMNWRSVALEEDNGGIVVIPNSYLMNAVVRNLDANGDQRAVEMMLTLDFSLPVERGNRVLTAAVMAATQEAGIVKNPEPVAFAFGPGVFGVEYKICFSYHASTINEGHARSIVIRHVMRHLKETGLSISLPKQNVFVGEARMMAKSWDETLDREKLISSIALFRSLEPHELRQLAGDLVIRRFETGAEIIREGETTTSMYGLAEGLLEVTVTNETQDLVVAVIEPGQCFGEMSMLADEPRSATVTALVESVVFEIRRDSFSEILVHRMEVAETISRLIAERQLSNNDKMQQASEQERSNELTSVSDNLLDRIRSVFSLFSRSGDQ